MELRVAGYQFPNLEAGSEPRGSASWDANWLLIDGSVRVVDGASWSFRGPVLTTSEVATLVTWLQQVADGTMPAAAVEDAVATIENAEVNFYEQLAPAGWLTFTEPNLSFAVRSQTETHVEMLIGLSHETAQPPTVPQQHKWSQRPQRSQIVIAMTKHQVRDAAADLQGDLVIYPAR